jgi:hypothetical protein
VLTVGHLGDLPGEGMIFKMVKGFLGDPPGKAVLNGG